MSIVQAQKKRRGNNNEVAVRLPSSSIATSGPGSGLRALQEEDDEERSWLLPSPTRDSVRLVRSRSRSRGVRAAAAGGTLDHAVGPSGDVWGERPADPAMTRGGAEV